MKIALKLLMLILLSSCAGKLSSQPTIILTKVYNHSSGVAPPRNIKNIAIYAILDFITTKHIKNITLEIGSEIMLGANGCSIKDKKYIIGSKQTNPFEIASNLAQNYQYKPEYDKLSLPAGKYQLCALRQYRFTEYNQEYEFEEFDVAFRNKWILLKAGEVIYLGDIYINKDKYKVIANPGRLSKAYPGLAHKIIYRRL